MKRPLGLLATVWLACLAGCHFRDPSIDLLEGELRWREDQIYQLEDELKIKCQQLAECRSGLSDFRCEPAPAPAPQAVSIPRQQPSFALEQPEIVLPEGSSGGSNAYEVLDAPTESPRPQRTHDAPTASNPTPAEPLPVGGDPPSPRGNSQPALAAPDRSDTHSQYEVLTDTPTSSGSGLDLPTDAGSEELLQPPEQIPEGVLEGPLQSDGTPAPDGAEASPQPSPQLDIRLSSYEAAAPRSGGPDVDADIDADVTHVVCQAWRQSDESDNNMSHGDLMVLIEPRNAEGTPVMLGAPVTIVVLDGAQSGDAARVARWDFTAAQARRRLRKSPWGRGIHLQLDWPATPPDSDELQVFVRYVTVEGRNLETDQKLLDNRPEPGTADHPPAVAGWRPASRPSHHANAVQQASLEQTQSGDFAPVSSGIRLQPIPKAGIARAATEPLGNSPEPVHTPESTDTLDGPLAAEPDVLPDESVPEWQPER